MIAIIDHGSGNLASVKNVLGRLKEECVITDSPELIASADGVICPGQGRAGVSMRSLRKAGLDKLIAELKTPFLGICVGMQLLGEYSEEDEDECLGVLGGSSRKFPNNLKSPHLGWNQVDLECESELMAGIDSGAYFYFVHSYYLDATKEDVVATTKYGIQFPSVARKNNFFAVQFHPEKSGTDGLQLLRNFCKLCS